MRFTASTSRFLYRHKSTYSSVTVIVSRYTSPGARARCIEQGLYISFTGFRPVFTLYRELCIRGTASNVHWCYKGYTALVLLAGVDSVGVFAFVDIGLPRVRDAACFNNSQPKQNIANGVWLNAPSWQCLDHIPHFHFFDIPSIFQSASSPNHQ